MSAEKVKIKLTPKQNSVIYCLQNGWVLITDMMMSGAIVGNNKLQYNISSGLFWRLVNMNLIYQKIDNGFDYTLTELGKNCITKKVDF